MGFGSETKAIDTGTLYLPDNGTQKYKMWIPNPKIRRDAEPFLSGTYNCGLFHSCPTYRISQPIRRTMIFCWQF